MDTKLFIDVLATRSPSKFEQLPAKITDGMPKKEPTYDQELGIVYRVLEPFYTKQAVEDVTTAMMNGEISSGTRWPRQMAEKICATYSVPVAFPTSSGASALHVSLLAIDVYQYEVIVPAFTMVAVSNAVKLAGGIPIYADCAETNINPGLAEIKARSSIRTKAVIICHTYGIVCPDVIQISEWCKQNGIKLIEDICECMGARVAKHPDPKDPVHGKYLLAGAFGDFSCSSLYANKQITAGDGGWVHSISEEHAPRLKSLINHGFDPAFMNRGLHEQIEKRHVVARWYRQELFKQGLSEFDPHSTSAARPSDEGLDSGFPLRGINEYHARTCFFDAPWVFGLECRTRDTRDNLRQFLAEHGVESRNYFFPLHVQPVNFYEYARGVSGAYASWDCDLPNSLRFGTCGLYLPTHAFLEENDVEYIVGVCRRFFDHCAVGVDGEAADGHSGVEGGEAAVSIARSGSAAVDLSLLQRKKGWVDAKRSELLKG
eukprot:g8433.t1